MYDDRFYGPTKFSASPVVGIELDKKRMTSPLHPLPTTPRHSHLSLLTQHSHCSPSQLIHASVHSLSSSH